MLEIYLKNLSLKGIEYLIDDSIPFDKFPIKIQSTLDAIALRNKKSNQ